MDGNKQRAESQKEPVKTFEGHEDTIISIATFPDSKRIATGSFDKTIRIWRLEDELKKWQVLGQVGALGIFRNGKYVHVVSTEVKEDEYYDKKLDWQVWVRDAETGKVVAGPLDGHTQIVFALAISPDRRMLASGSFDGTVILWDTSTWQRKGDPLMCGARVNCNQFSWTGQLAVATTQDIQIWDLDLRERLAQFNGHHDFNTAWNFSLTWTRDGARLLSAGGQEDPVIRSWDTSTWAQAGDPWTGHDKNRPIEHIILNSAGTLLASASYDHTVRLWQVPAGTEVARFHHSDEMYCVAFSVDGRFIFCSGHNKVSQWEIPERVLAAVRSNTLASKKDEAGPSKGKQRYMNRFFDSEISGQCRNKSRNHERITHSEHPSSSCLFDIRTFFSSIRRSSGKGKQKARQPKQKAPGVVDVPLGEATYQDVVGVDDGTRPYVLFFCLSWFQGKKKKPDPPRPVYDDELEDDESEEAILSVPIPTNRVQPPQQQEIELKPVASQSQPDAGPSRLAQSS